MPIAYGYISENRDKTQFKKYWNIYNQTRLTSEQLFARKTKERYEKTKKYYSILEEILPKLLMVPNMWEFDRKIFDYGYKWKTKYISFSTRAAENQLIIASEPENDKEVDEIINIYFKDEAEFLLFYKDPQIVARF